jgi:O-antigen/teichoic acid export membrane protein
MLLSVQNLGLALIASWRLPADEFAVVAAALAFVQLSQAVVLAGVGEVVLVKPSSSAGQFREYGIVPLSALIGGILAFLLLPVAIQLGWSYAEYFGAAFLLISVSWAFGNRVVAYAVGAARRSVVASVLPVGATLAVSILSGSAELTLLAVALSLVVGTFWLRLGSRGSDTPIRHLVGDAKTFVSRNSPELKQSVTESVFAVGAYPLVIIAVGLLSGAIGSAFLQAGSSLLGPVTVIVLAGRLMALPVMADAYASGDTRRFNRQLLIYSGAGLASSIVFSIMAILIAPLLLDNLFDEIGASEAALLMLLMCLHRILSTLGTGPSLALRALGNWRMTAGLRVFAGLSTIVLAVLGSVLGGVRGAIVGICIAASVSSVLWTRAYLAQTATLSRGK